MAIESDLTRYLKKYGTPGWTVAYHGGEIAYHNEMGSARIVIVEGGFKCIIETNKGRNPVDRTTKTVASAINHVLHKLYPYAYSHCVNRH